MRIPMTDAHPPRILIVDDDSSVAKVLESLVRRAGYDVRVAGHANDALALLADGIDAMVVDLRMPDMRGDAFYYLASARHPHLADRTILMTGDLTEQAEYSVTVTGCPLLRKPFPGTALYALLARMAPITSSNSEAS